MKKALYLLPALALGLISAGCANTLNGAKQDAATDTQKTQQAADQAGKAVAKVPQDIGAAIVVTPEVKTAIIRDPILNDPSNLINVNSHDHAVVLTGHVSKASMKQRATDDAQNVVDKRHGDFTVDDQLTVAGAQ